MDPRLRKIIDAGSHCRRTIREAAAFLPEDPEVLDGWIAEAVERADGLTFVLLVCGALHKGLPVRSRHLEHGLKFIPGFRGGGCMILQVSGDDVPQRVERALRLGGIAPSSFPYYLLAAWHWCADRSVPFPPELLNAARGYAHRFGKLPDLGAGFYLFAVLADDRRLKEIIRACGFPDAACEMVESRAGEITSEILGIFRDDILETVGEDPAPPRKPQTVRRAAGHIGRNDPCPCGSGKKHKHCCSEKTRERLLHSSDVAGLTMEELDAELEAHMTPQRLETLDTAKAIRLDPRKLDPALIAPLVRKLSSWKLYEEAAAVLEKAEMTDDLYEEWENLLMLAAHAGRKNVVRRLVALYGDPGEKEEKDYLPLSARLLLAEGDAEKTLAILEETARMLVDETDPGLLSFHGLGFLSPSLGALGIMLSQSVIARLDIGMALSQLDLLATRRAQLDLPIVDPMAAFIEKRMAMEADKEGNKDSAKLAAALRRMDALAESERKAALAARQMEKEIARLTREAAERKPADPGTAPPDGSGIKALREKLRIHEANERANAEERAAHRRTVGQLLALEEKLRQKERSPADTTPTREEEAEEDRHLLQGELEGAQPLRLLTFPGKFLESIRPFPRHIGRHALALLGRLAAGEPAALHDALRLKACHDVFRSRVGIGHRLLFRLHPEEIEVIALIDRRDLDARIKTLRKHG